MKKIILIVMAGGFILMSDYLHTAAGAGAGAGAVAGHNEQRSHQLGQELLQLMKNYIASESNDLVSLEGNIRQLIVAGADLSVRNEIGDTALWSWRNCGNLTCAWCKSCDHK
jgi:uncharacterized protein (UPF0333 family)